MFFQGAQSPKNKISLPDDYFSSPKENCGLFLGSPWEVLERISYSKNIRAFTFST